MKEEYVNPFLAPAKNVWEKMLGQELELDEFAMMSEQVTTEDITAIIRVKGFVEGHVLYGFDIDTAKAVASVMMEEEVEEFDEIALSALGELANVISGNAATELSSAGFFCQISPPQILQAPGFGTRTLTISRSSSYSTAIWARCMFASTWSSTRTKMASTGTGSRCTSTIGSRARSESPSSRKTSKLKTMS